MQGAARALDSRSSSAQMSPSSSPRPSRSAPAMLAPAMRCCRRTSSCSSSTTASAFSGALLLLALVAHALSVANLAATSRGFYRGVVELVPWEVKAKALGVKRRRANYTWFSTYAHAFLARCIFCATPIKKKKDGGEYPFIKDQPKGVRPRRHSHALIYRRPASATPAVSRRAGSGAANLIVEQGNTKVTKDRENIQALVMARIAECNLNISADKVAASLKWLNGRNAEDRADMCVADHRSFSLRSGTPGSTALSRRKKRSMRSSRSAAIPSSPTPTGTVMDAAVRQQSPVTR